MRYVIGVDLGTSSVKILLVNQEGKVENEIFKDYPLIQNEIGHIEQNPQHWIDQTIMGLTELLELFEGDPKDIHGISFSGQMHGLVLLDEHHKVLRNAILWNDTRTTAQCKEIYNIIGKERLLSITKNLALEGFTLPKILWVKEHEPEIFSQTHKFLLPKDYLRYKLTGKLHTELSDAAGTLLLNVADQSWSEEICELLEIDSSICPPLVNSIDSIGNITPQVAKLTSLYENIKVFAGAADNACGAIGSGVLTEGKTLCSLGTSGVVLSHESSKDKNFQGKIHYFNHGATDAYYAMGVTLAAGYSLSWFKDIFAQDESVEKFIDDVASVPIGSNGLLFTPYLFGERTPHADANIRASFIGMDNSHQKKDFVRSIMEGITFSLNESIQVLRENGQDINSIVSIGGGAKNNEWLQMQADIFNASIEKLSSEQGPAMGAAMIASIGCGWFDTLQDCANEFLEVKEKFTPIKKNVEKYRELFKIYQKVYYQTNTLNEKLLAFRS